MVVRVTLLRLLRALANPLLLPVVPVILLRLPVVLVTILRLLRVLVTILRLLRALATTLLHMALPIAVLPMMIAPFIDDDTS